MPGPSTRPSRSGTGRRGLRFRVGLLVAVGVVVPAALVAGASWVKLGELDREVTASRRAAVAAVAEHLDEELTSDLEVLQRLAASRQLERASSGGSDRALEAVRAAHQRSSLRGIFVVDVRGRLTLADALGTRSAAPPADLGELAQTLADGKPRITGLVGGGEEARVYALVATRDWRGQLDGVVGAALDPALPARAHVLQHLLRGSGGHADLVDAAGAVLASTDRGRQGRPVACAPQLARLVADRRPATLPCGVDGASGESLLARFVPLSIAPWGVLVAEPGGEAQASGSLARTLALLAAGLLVVSGAFAWGAARSVTRPIAVLTAATERIAAGDLDEPIPELEADELGRLGGSVERMRAALRKLLADVARANEELERRVDERTRELARANQALEERDAQRRRLLRTVITAQEDERRRIARELHDETTQSLAVLVMGLETASAALRGVGPPPRLDEVKALAVHTLDEVHRLILDLRPAVLDDLGLFSALRWYAERTLGSRGIAVRCEIQELGRRLPPEMEAALFRIGQEAMNNVARHAGAESVLIQLGPEPAVGKEGPRELRIEIEDDGRGFDPEAAPTDRPHYGLLGIRERAELLGGSAIVDASPGGGTRVEVRVPLPPEEPG